MPLSPDAAPGRRLGTPRGSRARAGYGAGHPDGAPMPAVNE